MMHIRTTLERKRSATSRQKDLRRRRRCDIKYRKFARNDLAPDAKR
jgi:hypothetical protein